MRAYWCGQGGQRRARPCALCPSRWLLLLLPSHTAASQSLFILWRTIEDHDTLFVLAEIAHFVGIGLLGFKMYSKRSAAGNRRAQQTTGALLQQLPPPCAHCATQQLAQPA